MEFNSSFIKSSHIPITALLQFCSITITDTTCEEGYTFSVDGQNCTGKPDTSHVHKAPIVKWFLWLYYIHMPNSYSAYCVQKCMSAYRKKEGVQNVCIFSEVSLYKTHLSCCTGSANGIHAEI